MYYDQDCTLPITFEVYTNATVHEDTAMPIIINNNTHIIREWEGIYGYFEPTTKYIQTLWLELVPAFEYFLDMTPRVDIDITSISGGIHTGENVTLATSMHCLSPRLGTKESMKILDSSSMILDTVVAVGAGQTLVDHSSFVLTNDLGGSGFMILIGNNYTGYTQFRLSAGSPLDYDLVLISIGIGVVLVAVVVFVYMKKK
jgi:hypothetical protein